MQMPLPKCKVTILRQYSAVKGRNWSFSVSEGKSIRLIGISHRDEVIGDHWSRGPGYSRLQVGDDSITKIEISIFDGGL